MRLPLKERKSSSSSSFLTLHILCRNYRLNFLRTESEKQNLHLIEKFNQANNKRSSVCVRETFQERKFGLSAGTEKRSWCVVRWTRNLVKADQRGRVGEREREREREGGYVMHSTEPFLLLLSIKAGGSAPACGCQAGASRQHSPRHPARCPTSS